MTLSSEVVDSNNDARLIGPLAALAEPVTPVPVRFIALLTLANDVAHGLKS